MFFIQHNLQIIPSNHQRSDFDQIGRIIEVDTSKMHPVMVINVAIAWLDRQTIRAKISGETTDPPDAEYYVTLAQMAAIVHESKRALERWIEPRAARVALL